MSGFRSCVFLVCLSFVAASSVRAQTVLFEDDFEQGTAKWSIEDYWHLATDDSACLGFSFPSGNHCMWYGMESSCNFDGPIQDFRFLRPATPITLPTGGGGVFLEFWSMSQTEDDTFWDSRKVRVSTDGGNSWNTLLHITDPSEPWTQHTVDLSAYAGQTIDLAFVFWAGDWALNDYLGWLIDDVEIRTGFEVYRRSCFGDGSAVPCPCGNSSAPGEKAGCLNSLGTAGKLRGSGLASLANDTLELSGSEMTSTTVFYYQGASVLNGGLGVAYGDGLSCVGGPIRRLGTTTNSGGASTWPLPGGESISVRGQVFAPGARWYQARYRNAVNFCTPETFSSTNVVKVNWTL